MRIKPTLYLRGIAKCLRLQRKKTWDRGLYYHRGCGYPWFLVCLSAGISLVFNVPRLPPTLKECRRMAARDCALLPAADESGTDLPLDGDAIASTRADEEDGWQSYIEVYCSLRISLTLRESCSMVKGFCRKPLQPRLNISVAWPFMVYPLERSTLMSGFICFNRS